MAERMRRSPHSEMVRLIELPQLVTRRPFSTSLRGDEFFDTAGEVGDVAELAGFTDGQVGGEGGATPSAKERLSFGIGQLFRPRCGVREG